MRAAPRSLRLYGHGPTSWSLLRGPKKGWAFGRHSGVVRCDMSQQEDTVSRHSRLRRIGRSGLHCAVSLQLLARFRRIVRSGAVHVNDMSSSPTSKIPGAGRGCARVFNDAVELERYGLIRLNVTHIDHAERWPSVMRSHSRRPRSTTTSGTSALGLWSP